MRDITMSDAIQEAIREEMRRDNRVYLTGTGVGPYGVTFMRPFTEIWQELGRAESGKLALLSLLLLRPRWVPR